MDLIENMGDATEALEECFDRIKALRDALETVEQYTWGNRDPNEISLVINNVLDTPADNDLS